MSMFCHLLHFLYRRIFVDTSLHNKFRGLLLSVSCLQGYGSIVQEIEAPICHTAKQQHNKENNENNSPFDKSPAFLAATLYFQDVQKKYHILAHWLQCLEHFYLEII